MFALYAFFPFAISTFTPNQILAQMSTLPVLPQDEVAAELFVIGAENGDFSILQSQPADPARRLMESVGSTSLLFSTSADQTNLQVENMLTQIKRDMAPMEFMCTDKEKTFVFRDLRDNNMAIVWGNCPRDILKVNPSSLFANKADLNLIRSADQTQITDNALHAKITCNACIWTDGFWLYYASEKRIHRYNAKAEWLLCVSGSNLFAVNGNILIYFNGTSLVPVTFNHSIEEIASTRAHIIIHSTGILTHIILGPYVSYAAVGGGPDSVKKENRDSKKLYWKQDTARNWYPMHNYGAADHSACFDRNTKQMLVWNNASVESRRIA